MTTTCPPVCKSSGFQQSQSIKAPIISPWRLAEKTRLNRVMVPLKEAGRDEVRLSRSSDPGIPAWLELAPENLTGWTGTFKAPLGPGRVHGTIFNEFSSVTLSFQLPKSIDLGRRHEADLPYSLFHHLVGQNFSFTEISARFLRARCHIPFKTVHSKHHVSPLHESTLNHGDDSQEFPGGRSLLTRDWITRHLLFPPEDKPPKPTAADPIGAVINVHVNL